MNAVEKLEAAIRRLGQVKQTLGYVATGEDPSELYARLEEDTDDDGEFFAYGLQISGGDSDGEINDALVLLNGTIDAQLAILRHAIEESGSPFFVFPLAGYDQHVLALADAILGGAS